MRRLLIVEDERDICDCLEQYFRGKGFSVASVFSGEEALACLAENPPDILLLDILLPGLSGLEVLRRVRTLAPQTQVVMVTGVDRVEVKAEAKLYGAVGYVTKPFDFSEATWAPVLTG